MCRTPGLSYVAMGMQDMSSFKSVRTHVLSAYGAQNMLAFQSSKVHM